jgi:putative two-component system response regulator
VKSELTRPIGDIVVVDDTPANLQLLVGLLKERGHRVRPVPNGRLALEAVRRQPPDLILLDINMPQMDGYEVCAALKADPQLADVPVIFISANTDVFDKVNAFDLGGADYVTKPFQFAEVQARVEAHLDLRRLRLELKGMNRSLQDQVWEQAREISDSQVATILALAKVSESRDKDTGSHILRVQQYCRALAKQLGEDGVFGAQIDDAFVNTIFHASALHDIGKAGIPDSILLKPGKHTPEEWTIMMTHSAMGAETLSAVLVSYPKSALLRMGRDIARSHHERWDGSGYPDGLVGEAIPLAARILTIADQYDALRNQRPYKPAFDAAKTYRILTEGDGRSDPRHLDPQVLVAFKAVTAEFEAIFEHLREPVSE